MAEESECCESIFFQLRTVFKEVSNFMEGWQLVKVAVLFKIGSLSFLEKICNRF